VLHLLASITDPVVDFAVGVVGDLGLLGIFVLMVLESACIPIPSEATMLFAGFNVAANQYSLLAATLVASGANLVGSWIAYGIGRAGRVDLIERHGRKVGISPKHLEWADRWFQRHGDSTVFFTRLLPIVRTFISLPAGVAKMPFWRFSALTLAGCVPWMLLLTFIGVQVGERWRSWQEYLHYIDYAVVAALAVAAVYLVARWRRDRRQRRTSAQEA